MASAMEIGRYYLEHAKAAYALMGADPVVKQSEQLLGKLKKVGLTEFTRRDAMRLCRNFKTAESLRPVLERLTEYGYIAPKQQAPYMGAGRPAAEVYLINPSVLSF